MGTFGRVEKCDLRPHALASMKRPGRREPVSGYEDFFRATGPRLVALGYVFTGDRGQAQDLAQETLLRAWQRWEKVSAYEDPAAWCRRVLSNLATSEWRKSSRRRAVLPSTLIAPEPDVEALELARALDTLPPPQRTAIVLHDAGDLSVADVAANSMFPRARSGHGSPAAGRRSLPNSTCPIPMMRCNKMTQFTESPLTPAEVEVKALITRVANRGATIELAFDQSQEHESGQRRQLRKR